MLFFFSYFLLNCDSQVLSAYKELHKARKIVFKNDSVALEAGKYKIREEFRKNANLNDQNEIQKLAKVAEETAVILRKTIVQAVLNKNGNYKLNITEHSFLQNNVQLVKKNMCEKRHQSGV